jgi:HAD superfamily hydrolase (TIGR01509 family)
MTNFNQLNQNLQDSITPNISNLVFDFWGVIVFEDTEKLAREVCIKAGLDSSGLIVLHKMLDDLIDFTRTHQKEKIQNWIRKYEQFTKLKVFSPDIWGDNFYLNQDLLSLINRLSNKYNIYFLTNINEYRFQKVTDSLNMNLFTGGVASFQIEIRKPDPAIYNHLSSYYNLDITNSIFIDDQLQNIQAAKDLGWRTFWYDLGVVIF